MNNYFLDQLIAKEEYISERIHNYMKLSNEKLYELTKHSGNTLVISIRQYYFKYNKLSDKQKYRLAEELFYSE